MFISKRRIAKFAMHTATSAVVTSAADATLTKTTDMSDEAVGNTSLALGTAVMLLTWNKSNEIVDRIADWNVNRKNGNDAPTA